MKRGLRYLPAPHVGRRRAGVLGLGLMAAMSLVWQQQATLASFIDAERVTATFTAATLAPIMPEPVAGVAKVDVSWAKASGSWATPAYQLDGSASGSGNATTLYAGAARSFSQVTGAETPSNKGLAFSEVAAGATHACGIAQGRVYCWGTSNFGGLGLGASTVARIPSLVDGGDLGAKVATHVTAGTDFTCATAEESAYCWGLGTNGQLGNGTQNSSLVPKAVPNLSAVTSLSAGAAHACAVATGKAYCWGQGTSGQIGDGGSSRKESPTLVRADGVLKGRTVARIAAGGSHTCVVAGGQAYCWGLNSSGQLGDGTGAQQLNPVRVDLTGVLMGRVVSRVTAGATHTCAIADGAAYCWGNNANGQLGNGSTSTTAVRSPVPVATMTGAVTALSAGSATTCAVAGGKAFCWGSRASYGVGDNSNASNQTSPAFIAGSLNGREAADVSAGAGFGCAVADNSPAACWGLGASYQQGRDAASDNKTPAYVSLSGLACPDLSVRTSPTTCSLLQDTDYYYRLSYSVGAWDAPSSEWVKATTRTRPGVDPTRSSATGSSITLAWAQAEEAGQSYAEYTVERSTAGDGSNPVRLAATGQRTFVDTGGIPPTRMFTAVSGGGGHTCAIVSGALYCWGLNSAGQLGVGDTNVRTVPTQVAGLIKGKTVTAVSAGQNHTCAIADGKAYCWGLNSYSQLGDGTASTSASPVAVATSGVLSGKVVTKISAGSTHTCAVADARAYCWGSNTSGQLGDGTNLVRTAPVAVTTNTGGLGTKVVSDVAVGGSHSCAVAGGAAFCWGANSDGQLGTGTLTSSTTPVAVSNSNALLGKTITAVTAGASHTCVLGDQRAYCWGDDSSGQLGNNKKASDRSVPTAVNISVMPGVVTALAAGNLHTCAVASGETYCWGENSSSQLGRGTTSTTDSGLPVLTIASGALGSAAVTSVAAGGSHSCAVADGTAYCWGSGADGRLGDGTTDSSMFAKAVAMDARCAQGSVPFGDGTCSLAPATTYKYRITFTLDGATVTKGAWTGLTTNN